MLIIISHDIAWQNLPNPHKSTSVSNPGPLYPAFAIDPWFGGSPVGHFLGFPGMGYPKMDGWSGGTPILGNLHIILVKQSQLSKNHREAQNLRKMDILLNIWPQRVQVSFWAFPCLTKNISAISAHRCKGNPREKNWAMSTTDQQASHAVSLGYHLPPFRSFRATPLDSISRSRD